MILYLYYLENCTIECAYMLHVLMIVNVFQGPHLGLKFYPIHPHEVVVVPSPLPLVW